MSALAVMLIAMGITDVSRRLTVGLWLPVVIAPVIVVGCALLAALWHLGDIGPLAIAAAASIAWVTLCARVERTGEHELAPLVVFGAAIALLILLSGWGPDAAGLLPRWSTWVDLPGLGDVSADRLLMVVGVVLLPLVTGNQLVRLVLGSVGAIKPVGEPQPSDRLKAAGCSARWNGC